MAEDNQTSLGLFLVEKKIFFSSSLSCINFYLFLVVGFFSAKNFYVIYLKERSLSFSGLFPIAFKGQNWTRLNQEQGTWSGSAPRVALSSDLLPRPHPRLYLSRKLAGRAELGVLLRNAGVARGGLTNVPP